MISSWREEQQVLTLMPEPYAASCVWDGRAGLDDDGLAALGVSAALIQRLRAWNEAHGAPIAIGRNHELAVGQPFSIRLARQLQKELPDYEIRLSIGRDEWVVGTDPD